MKFAGIKFICRLLIASLLMLQFPLVRAEMIGADQVLSPATVQADRSNVATVLGRSEVVSQLQSMGVDPKLAQERVASMTDSEIHALAGNLETMPAGAMFAGGWWILAALVIGTIVYFTWKR